MTPDEAAWVREHAWLPKMRRWLWRLPGGGSTYDAALALSRCECVPGVCGPCSRDVHKWCNRRTIRPLPEWWINHFRPPVAPVWHADRACRSLCPCDCPKPKPVYEVVMLPGFDDLAVTA